MNPLDNPFWSALSTHHARLATIEGAAGRYLAEVAPFAGVSESTAPALAQLERLVKPGESVYLLGVLPELGTTWTVQARASLPQMVCASPIPVHPGPDWVELTDEHRGDMLALTALVFPGFFRPRTSEMGRYIGIYDGDRLAAMAGERLRMNGYQEISAVCTHPEYVGRGYAHRLVAIVSNAAFARGFTPFLHVYRENVRAMSVYERLGFAVRKELPFCHVTRQQGQTNGESDAR
jgi:ribosomal protein S18 acetylase RimI-like enzyme